MKSKMKCTALCALLVLLLAVCPVSTALARAGGGGGGGGGGGAGGGGGGTHATGTGGSGGSSSPLADIGGYVLFALAASGGAIVFFVRVHVRGARARRTMEKLAAADPTWGFADYRRTVRHIFYTVQQAWMERDQDIARDCLSRSLYDQYHTKSEWMALRHEKNILRNIRLLEAMPVDVEDDAGEQNDRMWVYIHARMVDYTVDDRTMELKSGDRLPRSFVEYWKIIREDGRWVLDEIRQKDELNLNTM